MASEPPLASGGITGDDIFEAILDSLFVICYQPVGEFDRRLFLPFPAPLRSYGKQCITTNLRERDDPPRFGF